MEQASDLREELLKQMDRDAGSSGNVPQKLAQAVLAKDMARLRRIKRFTLLSWLLLAAAFLASGITGALTGFRSELWIISSIIGLQALLIIAVALTFALTVRSRTLKMSQIQAALADIHEQLKTLRSLRS
ncbi:MAG: hypothetical protein NT147_01930 [Candidatus Aminicenantes bacterium]|nr:hypothetical protein [Candidatus Aminicenantes bacterium]